MSVKRIFVEKKQGFDVESQKLYRELKENLHIQNLTGVRVINRYDVEGLDETTYESARITVFSEPAIDLVYEEKLDFPADFFIFAVEYLPGQYDQRADSAVQCIRMINPSADTVVRFARVYVLLGELAAGDKEKIRNYCINPVDSREAELEKPASLAMVMEMPEAVEVVFGFISWNKKELEAYRKAMGFAMSPEDILFVQQYFQKDDRDPTITELRVIDTYWSDHCRHTTFFTGIEDVQFEDGPYGEMIREAYEEYLELRKKVYEERVKEKDVCLMDLAVIGAKYLRQSGFADDIDESEEINACSIKVKAEVDGRQEDWLVMFKNETHNHPTEIEPFGGAATCLGGAIRDPLSGRVYVYQAMRVTGSGDPRTSIEETIPGKLPQRTITKGAAHGYSSYGNQIGLATGQVAEIYDEGYVAKRMEIGAVIGAAPADHVIRKRPQPGDLIVLVGGRTGRDGCGGATGSSKEHTEDSIATCGAEVQKGNPPVERNIQRFYRRKEVSTLIKRCNDFGAGGVSVAIGELADSIDVNLDLVPKKYEGLDGTELAISESQERMAAVVAKEDCDAFIKLAAEENLEATVVAYVTDTGCFRMFWRDECILRLDREFLDTNGARQTTNVAVSGCCGLDGLNGTFESGSTGAETANAVAEAGHEKPEKSAVTARLTKEELAGLLSDLNSCSQKGLIENFDSTIGAATVLMPLGGKNQLTPACGMAAKLPVVKGDTSTATLMTFGFDPQLAKKSPYHSALYAVLDSATKIVAMGGDFRRIRLTFQEYFERLGTDPKKWSKPFAALLGALKAQLELGIPAIGGKDSMSGTFMDISVPPTLVSFAVATEDAGKILSPELKSSGSRLIYVSVERDGRELPDFEAYRKNMDAVRKLMESGSVLSASNVGMGGVFATVFKMAVGNGIGAEIKNLSSAELTEPQYGALILEVAAETNLESLFSDAAWKEIGCSVEEEKITVAQDPAGSDKLEFDLGELMTKWQEPLEDVFPTIAKAEFAGEPETVSFSQRNSSRPKTAVARPRVLIPAFPGTNCEMDSARAFEKAGAIPQIQIIRNRSEADLKESIEEMARNIKNSQIIMIPGGFSGGDEPDGSAKFIAALFRNEKIRLALEELMDDRDGLMLGICNGFQALIKLGLVPYGKITEMEDRSPTLTYNQIGRHVSCLARTRIASVKSPWLSFVETGDIHTIAVSHGEGRFIASQEMLKELAENGQIATQYVDMCGKPTMDPSHNPNGSTGAVCGITSPDGRILGKMGHSERIGTNLYKNVPGEKDQKLFAAGVAYFTQS